LGGQGQRECPPRKGLPRVRENQGTGGYPVLMEKVWKKNQLKKKKAERRVCGARGGRGPLRLRMTFAIERDPSALKKKKGRAKAQNRPGLERKKKKKKALNDKVRPSLHSGPGKNLGKGPDSPPKWKGGKKRPPRWRDRFLRSSERSEKTVCFSERGVPSRRGRNITRWAEGIREQRKSS